MQKVSIAAHRNQLQRTIDALYRMKLLDLDQYDGDLETGSPFEEAEELSEMLVRTRSIKSRLPDVEGSMGGSFQLSGWSDRLEEISSELDDLEHEVEGLRSRMSEKESKRDFLSGLRGSGLEVQHLEGTRRIDTIFVEGGIELPEELEKAEVFEGEKVSAVLFDTLESEAVTEAVRKSGNNTLSCPDFEEEGEIHIVIEDLEEELVDLDEKIEALNAELEKSAERWLPELKAAENFLEERVEKAEAPLNFATTERAFIVEGWVPEEKFEDLGEELHRVSGGKIHLQSEPTEEEPPVKYDNKAVVQPFESLTELVATPRYNELDPSALILLMFPAMFGFMIGDAGYGITTGLVFAAGMRYFESGREIFKSLLWASLFTFLFGLAFGDAFGYVIFGHHSELAAATGIKIFEQIPILWHRAEHLGAVFRIAAVIGFLQVNLGFLLGFYNEYVNHGLKEAFLEKISWIMVEIGALGWFAIGPAFGVPVLLIGLVSLGIGEGIEGLVEIPSLISNVLSYLRIFGVAVAAVSLAAVVNAMAEPLFSMGGLTGLVAGTAVLALGHSFNTGIKIMEGFLQGIRLHYVEFFTKFFEGGGRRFAPFGART